MAYCRNPECAEEFHPDESSDGVFCSWDCAESAEENLNTEEFSAIYDTV